MKNPEQTRNVYLLFRVDYVVGKLYMKIVVIFFPIGFYYKLYDIIGMCI
jgi:hypothetical protein